MGFINLRTVDLVCMYIIGSWKFEAAAEFPVTNTLTAELAGTRDGRVVSWLDAWLGQIFEDFKSQNIFPVKATCIQQNKADVRSAVNICSNDYSQ